MKLQAILSSVALVAAMSFSGAAVAQSNMIDDVHVPADKIQQFKDACAALQAKSTASLTTDDAADDPVDATTTGSTGANSQDSADPASEDYWDDLALSVTLEQCNSGGFLP
jgi:hypothetical protein